MLILGFVPSVSYPGMEALKLVFGSSRGKSLREMERSLEMKSWRLKSSIAVLRHLGLVEAVRDGKTYRYKRRRGSLKKSYISKYAGYLAPLLDREMSTRELSSLFWDSNKRSTRMKRATLLMRLGESLGVLESTRRRYSVGRRARPSVFACLLEAIYAERTEGSTNLPVSMTYILRKLRSMGVSGDIKPLLLKSLKEMNAELTPSPAIDDRVRRDGIRDRRGRYLYYLIVRGFRWVESTHPTG